MAFVYLAGSEATPDGYTNPAVKEESVVVKKHSMRCYMCCGGCGV